MLKNLNKKEKQMNPEKRKYLSRILLFAAILSVSSFAVAQECEVVDFNDFNAKDNIEILGRPKFEPRIGEYQIASRATD